MNGQVNFNAQQSDLFSKTVNDSSDGLENLCTYKSIRGAQRRFIQTHYFPNGHAYYVKKNNIRFNRSGSTMTVEKINCSDQDPRDCKTSTMQGKFVRIWCVRSSKIWCERNLEVDSEYDSDTSTDYETYNELPTTSTNNERLLFYITTIKRHSLQDFCLDN